MPSPSAAQLRAAFKSILTYHWLVTFIIMLGALIGFGLTSYNIFFFLNANLRFIAENGGQALAEGGFEQLFMLLLNGIWGALFYIVFKACEKILVEKLVK